MQFLRLSFSQILSSSMYLVMIAFFMVPRLDFAVAVDGHLCQPIRGRDAGLFLNGAEERWKVLEKIADRGGGVGSSVGGRTRVPDGDPGLQAVDGGCVGMSEFLVGVVFQHQVLEQAVGR